MRKAFFTPLTLTLLILSVCLPAFALVFTGKVVGVIDGDTIEVMHLGKAERVRLWGIDCPEMG
jgi:endonuclease YncB( thermonuclease family)